MQGQDIMKWVASAESCSGGLSWLERATPGPALGTRSGPRICSEGRKRSKDLLRGSAASHLCICTMAHSDSHEVLDLAHDLVADIDNIVGDDPVETSGSSVMQTCPAILIHLALAFDLTTRGESPHHSKM